MRTVDIKKSFNHYIVLSLFVRYYKTNTTVYLRLFRIEENRANNEKCTFSMVLTFLSSFSISTFVSLCAPDWRECRMYRHVSGTEKVKKNMDTEEKKWEQTWSFFFACVCSIFSVSTVFSSALLITVTNHQLALQWQCVVLLVDGHMPRAVRSYTVTASRRYGVISYSGQS